MHLWWANFKISLRWHKDKEINFWYSALDLEHTWVFCRGFVLFLKIHLLFYGSGQNNWPNTNRKMLQSPYYLFSSTFLSPSSPILANKSLIYCYGPPGLTAAASSQWEPNDDWDANILGCPDSKKDKEQSICAEQRWININQVLSYFLWWISTFLWPNKVKRSLCWQQLMCKYLCSVKPGGMLISRSLLLYLYVAGCLTQV